MPAGAPAAACTRYRYPHRRRRRGLTFRDDLRKNTALHPFVRQPRAPHRQRLFRLLPAGGGRCARRQTSDHALEPRRGFRPQVSADSRGSGPHLRQGWCRLDIRGHQRRNRLVVGNDRGRSRRVRCAAHGATTGGLLPPSRRPVTVLRAAGHGTAQRPLRSAVGPRAHSFGETAQRRRSRRAHLHEYAEFLPCVPSRNGNDPRQSH